MFHGPVNPEPVATAQEVVSRSVNPEPVATVVSRSVNPEPVATTGLPRALTTGHSAQGSLISTGQGAPLDLTTGQAGRTARALPSGQAAVSAPAARVLTTGQAAVSDPMGQGAQWTEALTTGQAAQSGLVSSFRAPSVGALTVGQPSDEMLEAAKAWVTSMMEARALQRPSTTARVSVEDSRSVSGLGLPTLDPVSPEPLVSVDEAVAGPSRIGPGLDDGLEVDSDAWNDRLAGKLRVRLDLGSGSETEEYGYESAEAVPMPGRSFDPVIFTEISEDQDDQEMEEVLQEEEAEEVPMEVDDLPTRGMDLPQSLADRLAGFFISHVGYEEVMEPEVEGVKSRLSFTNSLPPKPRSSFIPVDAEFSRIRKVVAESKPTVPKFLVAAFRFSPEDVALFETPMPSEEFKLKLQAEQGGSSALFRDVLRKRLDDDMVRVDRLARILSKFGSVLMLVGECLTRFFMEQPEDSDCFTRKELGALCFCVSPISRMMIYAAESIGCTSVASRRSNFCDLFAWPSAGARASCESISTLDPGVFAKTFLGKLEEEVKKFKEGQLAAFALLPKASSSFPARGRDVEP